MRRAWIIAGAVLLAGVYALHSQTILPPLNTSVIGCAYNASPTTLTTGQAGFAQCDSTGRLLTVPPAGGDAVTIADGADVAEGTTTDAACATDNGTCTVSAMLKRIAQRITSLITALGTPFQAGGSIGNTSFGNLPIGSASSANGIAPVVCGSAVSSCVLKAAAGNLYSVYAECSAACWLQVFNSVAAPSNGATTAGIASGNMVECIPIQAGGAGGISSAGMPPSVYTVGITATISSTTCATLTLATTGFVKGLVQ